MPLIYFVLVVTMIPLDVHVLKTGSKALGKLVIFKSALVVIMRMMLCVNQAKAAEPEPYQRALAIAKTMQYELEVRIAARKCIENFTETMSDDNMRYACYGPEGAVSQMFVINEIRMINRAKQ